MLKNTEKGYGLIAIFTHWLMALAIFFMFGLGLYMVELTYYDPWYKGALDLHKSIGIVLLVLLLFRLIWRQLNVKPAELPGPKLEQAAAKIGHIALYALMFVIMISGYLISTADGRPIMVFEIFEVPALPWSFENQEDIVGDIHFWLAWVLMGFVAGHIGAAIKHQYINKDGGLSRMLKVNK
ncbi:cytochrome b [Pseudoalteromonas sp. SMS1]|uniref:cytochrome b n=1 Tax=Pseudoalteromonas sp. SMS1 TaxID=2908894 RepID=UPI001F2F885E|nr:cytochrome b [Pseudoalteromonas sp. SMS1]MCF2858657.1 cytochrome b [Pseudoalteromonas sp. SMS1]